MFRAGSEVVPGLAPVRLRFDSVYPRYLPARASKSVSVRNGTALPLRFEWRPDDWLVGAPQPRSSALGSTGPRVRPNDSEDGDVFGVSPSIGVLPPLSVTEFTFSFCPSDLLTFQRAYRLCVRDVPLFGERRATLEAAEAKRKEREARLSAKGLAPEVDAADRADGKLSEDTINGVVVMPHGEGATVGALHIPRESVEVSVVYLQVRGV